MWPAWLDQAPHQLNSPHSAHNGEQLLPSGRSHVQVLFTSRGNHQHAKLFRKDLHQQHHLRTLQRRNANHQHHRKNIRGQRPKPQAKLAHFHYRANRVLHLGFGGHFCGAADPWKSLAEAQRYPKRSLFKKHFYFVLQAISGTITTTTSKATRRRRRRRRRTR